MVSIAVFSLVRNLIGFPVGISKDAKVSKASKMYYFLINSNLSIALLWEVEQFFIEKREFKCISGLSPLGFEL